MTRKHFEAIARDFKDLADEMDTMENLMELVALKRLAMRLAKTFKAVNPRFDSARFITACGM